MSLRSCRIVSTFVVVLFLAFVASATLAARAPNQLEGSPEQGKPVRPKVVAKKKNAGRRANGAKPERPRIARPRIARPVVAVPKEGAKVAAATAENAGAAKGPKSVTVRPKPFRVTVELPGTFAARQATEVALAVEEWSRFEVVKAVPHGATVHRGERLVELDTRAIDQAIADLEVALDLSALALGEAEADLEAAQKALPLDLEAARIASQRADEDLVRFLKTDLPASKENARFRVKSAENYLAYQREELRQLEKMYKADDLTEETEEIVLRRARDSVERAENSLENARRSTQTTLEVDLPRQQRSVEDAARRQTLAWRKAKATLELGLREKKLSVAKMRTGRKRSQEKLARLRRDRRAMELTSPAAGVVYYGRAVDGKFPGVSALEAKLRRGGQVLPDEVLMTVVSPGRLAVLVEVPEKELARVRPGMRGTIRPTAFPSARSGVRVEKVAAVPGGAGSFDAVLALAPAPKGKPIALVAGMTGTVEFVAHSAAKALTVPPAAIHESETAPGKSYVWVMGKGGPEKREVRAGERTDAEVEILKGLRSGDRVLLEKPE